MPFYRVIETQRGAAPVELPGEFSNYEMAIQKAESKAMQDVYKFEIMLSAPDMFRVMSVEGGFQLFYSRIKDGPVGTYMVEQVK